MDNVFEQIAAELLGTCTSVTYIIDKYELDESIDLEDILIDFNVEQCMGCGWWHESCELDGQDEYGEIVDENVGYCSQCIK